LELEKRIIQLEKTVKTIKSNEKKPSITFKEIRNIKDLKKSKETGDKA